MSMSTTNHSDCTSCGATLEACDDMLTHHGEACCEACEWDDAHPTGPSGTVTVRADGQVVVS